MIRVMMKGDKAAEILIYSDIGDSWWGDGVTAKDVAEQLKALDKVETIDVRINSYGGDVFDGLAIYRQLVDFKSAKIVTHVDGIAASAASVVAMAGQTIKVAETSFIMIHDAWTIAMGNAAELRAVAERVDTTSSELAKLYAHRSGKTEAVMREYMHQEKWFNAQEAIDAGLADEIAENQRVAARVVPGFVDYIRNFAEISEDRRPFRNLPEKLDAKAVEPIATPRLDGAKARIAEMQSRFTAAAPKASGRG